MCYTSNLGGPKAHNTLHINKKNCLVVNVYYFLREKKESVFFFFFKINQRKRDIYFCLILVTDLPFRRNKEKLKCLILRDIDK